MSAVCFIFLITFPPNTGRLERRFVYGSLQNIVSAVYFLFWFSGQCSEVCLCFEGLADYKCLCLSVQLGMVGWYHVWLHIPSDNICMHSIDLLKCLYNQTISETLRIIVDSDKIYGMIIYKQLATFRNL